MQRNISLCHSLLLCLPMGFFTNHLVLTPLNIMEWLSIRIVIKLRQLSTLLLQHKVPQRFGGDAIFAACYLINCMSSYVFHDQIPQFVLLPNQPLFCLPPRVFGCVCFLHILIPGQDKLSAKAMKCVFLGYSCLQRGYRGYSPDINL